MYWKVALFFILANLGAWFTWQFTGIEPIQGLLTIILVMLVLIYYKLPTVEGVAESPEKEINLNKHFDQ